MVILDLLYRPTRYSYLHFKSNNVQIDKDPIGNPNNLWEDLRTRSKISPRKNSLSLGVSRREI